MSSDALWCAGVILFVLLFIATVVIGFYLGVNYCELGHPQYVDFFNDCPAFCGKCGEALRTKCPDCCRSYVTAPEFCTRCGHHFEEVGNGK